MRLFETHCDGGKDSPVMGYWVIELKNWFSIAFLAFNPGTRENYHSHAFNAYTWWLSGSVTETCIDMDTLETTENTWVPSIWPKYTPRTNVHKVATNNDTTTWALTFRGPWADSWYEYDESNDKIIEMTNGRRVIDVRDR